MITPERIRRWVETFHYEDPHRFTVVRFTTQGCQFLLSPGVFVEENELNLAWKGGTKAEAAKRLLETYEILKARNEDEARKTHRSSCVIPVYDTNNPWADFPWPSPKATPCPPA
jgi:hypothetical protein